MDNLKQISQVCAGNVHYVSCDINNVDNVKAEVKKLPKTVTAIFHASGVLRDKLIEQKDIKDYEVVYNTKVRGLENVLTALGNNAASLKHVVIFSSLAGFYGNAGQCDYSMANEVLNKACYFLGTTTKADVKVFDFGPWDGGMVTPELKKMFLSNNVQIIDRESGAKTVAKSIMNSAKSQILVGNWGLAPQKPLKPRNELFLTLNKFDYLSDHSIHGKTVLPFTFALILMTEQLCGLYAGYHVKATDQVKLFRGISFDKESVRCQLMLNEIKSSETDVVIETKLLQLVNSSFVPAYQATIVITKLLPEVSNAKLVDVTKLATSKTLNNTDIYNQTTLFHGPKFQCINAVKLNREELVAKVSLIDKVFEEIPVNSLVLDAVFQAALVLAREVTGKAALPVNIESSNFSTSFFDGSKSFKNSYVYVKRLNGEKENVWKMQFQVQDSEVSAAGELSIAVNDKLSF